MGRSNMTSLKITLLPLAICFLLSLNSQVSGKPSPKYFLIETKEKAKKNSDYISINSINNHPGFCASNDPDRTRAINICHNNGDYIEGINNAAGGAVGTIKDASVNFGKDYVSNIRNEGMVKSIPEGGINYDNGLIYPL